jgi:hypothetical protein
MVSKSADFNRTILLPFFELGVPKVIAKALMDEDWHIDPNPGLAAFRFTRTGRPSYEIVHFAMNVSRQSPRREDRAPGTTPPHVMAAYKSFARVLFERPATLVNEATVAGLELRPSLDQIRGRRRKYYPDEMA